MKYLNTGARAAARFKAKPTRISAAFLSLTLMLTGGRTAEAQAYHPGQRSVDIVNGCARAEPELFAAGANPAVLGVVRKTRVAAAAEDAWGLPGTGYSRLMAAIPLSDGALGLGITHSGNTAYQESGLGLGYGLSLGKGSLGIIMSYEQFSAAGYRPWAEGAAIAGLRLALFPNLLAGFSFSVPFAVQRTASHVDQPAGDYRIEMGFLASEQVSLFAAWVKTDGLTAAVEIGLDYAFADHFFFTAGLHGRTGAPFAKTGWAKDGWRLLIFTAYQAPLGFSPGLAISWDRPGKNNGTEKKKNSSR